MRKVLEVEEGLRYSRSSKIVEDVRKKDGAVDELTIFIQRSCATTWGPLQ